MAVEQSCFVSPITLPSTHLHGSSHFQKKGIFKCSYRPEDSEHLSLETMSSFEAFCWRTQETLSRHTAEVDGLGTFQNPNTYPCRSTQRAGKLSMKGGRAFATATIDVFRNPSILSASRKTRRLLTSAGPVAESSPDTRESVGITLNLRPRDPVLPSLRASAHYFQVGGGRVSWWFSGSADLCVSYLCESHRFQAATDRFFDVWTALCEKYRTRGREREVSFLENCFSDSHFASTADRDTSFHFVSDMVDQIMPTYVTLLFDWNGRLNDSDNKSCSKTRLVDWPLAGLDLFNDEDTASQDEETVDRFSLPGGAACEVATVRTCPLGSWRFSLSPSELSAAGKEYASLRNHFAPLQSIMYM